MYVDPELIYDKAQTGEEGFEGVLDLFPSSFSLKHLQPELSGKLKCLVLCDMSNLYWK